MPAVLMKLINQAAGPTVQYYANGSILMCVAITMLELQCHGAVAACH